jgi:hypothetical protein
MTSKKQPIDPICALCRISLLNFKGINTKIGITGHAINIQEPGTVQGLWRYYSGDGREDLFELFSLVTHLIAWFLVPVGISEQIIKKHQKKGDSGETTEHQPEKKLDDAFVVDLKKMIGYMCMAFIKLQNTYKNGNVVLAIQYYINLLEDGLKGTFDIKRLPHCLIEDLWIDSPLKTKIVELWDYKRLHRICAVFDDCFMELSKESKIRDELIGGYLLSIENILSAYEREFNTMIKQWI